MDEDRGEDLGVARITKRLKLPALGALGRQELTRKLRIFELVGYMSLTVSLGCTADALGCLTSQHQISHGMPPQAPWIQCLREE